MIFMFREKINQNKQPTPHNQYIKTFKIILHLIIHKVIQINNKISQKIKYMKIVGQKYLQYTTQFRQMHHTHHINKIKDIMTAPRSNVHFERQFPQYPIQYPWKYKDMALHAYRWEPDAGKTKTKALLVNFNALNAHTGLSGKMAQVLAQAGIAMAGVDYPNFGKSHSPNPGHIESVHDLVELSQDFVMHVSQQHPGVPVYVNGLSMGGLIAFQVSLRKPTLISGCILLNPAFRDNPVNNGFLKKVMMLGGLLFPKFQTMKPMKSHSTKHSLQKYKKNDTLMYTGKVWTSTTWALLSNMRKIAKEQHFQEFKVPFLCIQGGSDKILNPFTVFELERCSKSKDKQIVIIPDLWHALWFDDHHDQIVQMVKNWILYRVDHPQLRGKMEDLIQSQARIAAIQENKLKQQAEHHGRHIHHHHNIHKTKQDQVQNSSRSKFQNNQETR